MNKDPMLDKVALDRPRSIKIAETVGIWMPTARTRALKDECDQISGHLRSRNWNAPLPASHNGQQCDGKYGLGFHAHVMPPKPSSSQSATNVKLAAREHRSVSRRAWVGGTVLKCISVSPQCTFQPEIQADASRTDQSEKQPAGQSGLLFLSHDACRPRTEHDVEGTDAENNRCKHHSLEG